MTVADSILAALVRASGGYGIEASFTWPDLCVLVWEADRKRFGMRGYEQLYPNTKAIQSYVSMMVPRKPWQKRSGTPTLERIGGGRGSDKQGVYRLTAAGLERGKAWSHING